MNCLKFEELFGELRDGIIDDKDLGTLKSHIEECSKCRHEQENLEKIESFLKESFQSETKAVEARDSILKKLSPTQPTTATERKRTMFEKLKKPAFAATAIVVVVVVLLLTGVFKTGPVAYALEQTIEANRNVRTIHWRVTAPEIFEMELWAEVDQAGNPVRMRALEVDSSDGPKEYVWQEGKIIAWLKKAQLAFIFKVEDLNQVLHMPDHFFNPRVLVDSLYRSEAEGDVRIETSEPERENDPIILTVTEVKNGSDRYVYEIDPITKLVQKIERYKLRDGDYEHFMRIEYLEYDQPLDPSMFVMDIPEGVDIVDQTKLEIGLAKGDLSDEEIATKVVRAFFEALIQKDYTRAGLMYQGFPAAKFEESFGKRGIQISILSMDKPTAVDMPVGAYRVHCKILLEVGGDTQIWEPHGPFVAPVRGNPDRWSIVGGI